MPQPVVRLAVAIETSRHDLTLFIPEFRNSQEFAPMTGFVRFLPGPASSAGLADSCAAIVTWASALRASSADTQPQFPGKTHTTRPESVYVLMPWIPVYAKSGGPVRSPGAVSWPRLGP
jgi:hypothetical protein